MNIELTIDPAEQERLNLRRAEHAGLRKEIVRLQHFAEGVQVERDALRTALARFGRHLVGCSFYRDGPHQASPDTVCDCGLNAAQRGT
jgi:hypothetical protein